MAWIGAVLFFVLIACGIFGVLMPTLGRILGWVGLAAALPLGFYTYQSGFLKAKSCGEMLGAVCRILVAGGSLVVVMAAAALAFALLVGSAVGRSRARTKAAREAARIAGSGDPAGTGRA